MSIKKSVFWVLCLLSSFCTMGQNKLNGLLWDKKHNKPIEFATIHNKENYAISNENGRFTIQSKKDTLQINILGYETKTTTFKELHKADTIFLKPKIFVLDEVVISQENTFKKMVKTLLTDYALQPHKEKFFLRCLVKKNNSILKIVDLSGKLEKTTLFDTSKYPMPKKNYRVQVENIRKSGVINRTYDFEMFSFKTILNRIASVYLSPKIYNFDYSISEDLLLYKINASPKNSSTTKTVGTYNIDKNTNTFKEVIIKNKDNESVFSKRGNVKFRTIDFDLKSNFKRSSYTNKYQINKAIIKAKTEVLSKNKTDILEVYYYFYATPLKIEISVKNNINLNRDIFNLKGKYNETYWKKNDVLVLTTEMQEFINKVNKTSKNKEFKTKTNMKFSRKR